MEINEILLLKKEIKGLKSENLILIEEIEKNYEKQNSDLLEIELLKYEFDQSFNNSKDCIWIVNLNYEIMKINDQFLKLVKKKRIDVLNKKCYEIFKNALCHTDQCPIKATIISKQIYEFDLEKVIGGKKKYFLVTSTLFYGVIMEVLGVFQSFKDISNRKTLELKLQKSSITDPLTKTFNRRKLNEQLQKEWSRLRRTKSPLSVVMIDVDYFKLYNDTYGHQAGDNCLVELAKVFNKSLFRVEDFVARYGGEEFIIVLPNTNKSGAIRITERILKNIENKKIEHSSSQAADHITISAGVTSKIPDDTNYEQLLKIADSALYNAKEQGRNQFIFQDSL